jgi:hypothetical protein
VCHASSTACKRGQPSRSQDKVESHAEETIPLTKESASEQDEESLKGEWNGAGRDLNLRARRNEDRKCQNPKRLHKNALVRKGIVP